jgi:hypothetical protein
VSVGYSIINIWRTDMSNEVFDFKKALEDLKKDKPLSGKDGISTPLVKKITEAALEASVRLSFE